MDVMDLMDGWMDGWMNEQNYEKSIMGNTTHNLYTVTTGALSWPYWR